MKTFIYVFVLTTCAVGMATTPSFADPWKDESGKYWDRSREWNKDRAEELREWQKDRREATREWEKDRREAAREWEKDQRERWREGRHGYHASYGRPPLYYERPHVHYEDYGPFPPPTRYEYAPYAGPYETRYRWHRFDDDDFYDDNVYQDDGHWRHGGVDRFRVRYRRPYYGEVYEPYYGYYYNRGGEVGARIGSQIGGALGGPEGAAIGAEIGTAIGAEVDD